MQTTIDRSAVLAMHNRARQLVLTCAFLGNPQNLRFAQGCLSSLQSVLDERGAFIAARDESIGGYEPATGFEAAWAALPVSAKNFSLAEMQEFLRCHGVEISLDLVPGGQIDAVLQFKNGEFTPFNLNKEETVARVESDDGAGLHAAPLVVVDAAIVTKGGAE